ncbi:MAG: peptidoglycan DD-metalloendopeptidase family protein [Patescibacteria group bacterium]
MVTRLLLILSLFWAILANQAFAKAENDLKAKIDEKNKEIERLELEIKEYQENLGEAEAKTQTLKSEITRIEKEIKNLNSQISLTEKKIQKKELEITSLGTEISQKEALLLEQKEALAKSLRELNEMESQNLLEMLLSYDNLSDFFDVIEDNQKLNSSIKESVEVLKTTKNTLAQEKTKAQEARDELKFLKNELGDKKSITNSQKSEKSSLFSETKNEEARFQKLLSEREREREAILDEIQRIEDELRGKIDSSALPEPRPGTLLWPIEGAILTQGFGNTPYSKILYNGQPHNGIDIKASVGTRVLASEVGVVKEMGNTDIFGLGTRKPCLSYGKWVLIEHPNGLSTLYAHLSLTRVQKGEIIKRGDLIAYSGSTGYATGPHLHFTVYESKTVQFGPSKLPKSTCEFLPFGGYLNPLAYL